MQRVIKILGRQKKKKTVSGQEFIVITETREVEEIRTRPVGRINSVISKIDRKIAKLQAEKQALLVEKADEDSL